jgi:hypothetical protein
MQQEYLYYDLRSAPEAHILVHPNYFSLRGFQAKGRSDLVLLRATDAPVAEGQDVTRLEASSLSSTAAILSAGLSKMETMVKGYASRQEEKKEEMADV